MRLQGKHAVIVVKTRNVLFYIPVVLVFVVEIDSFIVPSKCGKDKERKHLHDVNLN